MNESQIRADQRDFARSQGGEGDGYASRRPTLSVKKRPAVGNKPQGHEAFLKALEGSGAVVEVEKASSGDKVIGKIKTSDKYTISLRVPNVSGDWEGPYTTRVIFKHDISEFSPLMPTTPAEVH